MSEDFTMNVWIDQDLCTACALCPEIAPDFFAMSDDDGLAHVIQDDGSLGDMYDDQRLVINEYKDDVIDAATECPGECIMLNWEPNGA